VEPEGPVCGALAPQRIQRATTTKVVKVSGSDPSPATTAHSLPPESRRVQGRQDLSTRCCALGTKRMTLRYVCKSIRTFGMGASGPVWVLVGLRVKGDRAVQSPRLALSVTSRRPELPDRLGVWWVFGLRAIGRSKVLGWL
jgi:hypothetical protein